MKSSSIVTPLIGARSTDAVVGPALPDSAWFGRLIVVPETLSIVYEPAIPPITVIGMPPANPSALQLRPSFRTIVSRSPTSDPGFRVKVMLFVTLVAGLIGTTSYMLEARAEEQSAVLLASSAVLRQALQGLEELDSRPARPEHIDAMQEWLAGAPELSLLSALRDELAVF